MKKGTKLDRVYEDIEQTYGNSTPDAIESSIEKLQEEIDKKSAGLEKIPNDLSEKKEALEVEINSLQTKVNNLKGYSKNKTQITKIKDFKASIEKKLSQEVGKKQLYEHDQQDVLKELKEVLDKVKDEKYTMTLDQYEYNDLLTKKDVLQKRLDELDRKIENSSKRITELRAKIGKCDLAWKTLFTNKDWDEIQLRATSDSKRFTRKVDEKNPPVKPKNKEDKSKNKKGDPQIEDDVTRTISEKVKKIKEKNENNKEKEENNLPDKVSRWTKIKNWARKISSKIKKVFGKEKEEEPELKSGKRDEFLDGLRKYVDEDYRKQVQEEKVKESMEAHKVKPKQKEEKVPMTRDEGKEER